MTRALEELEQYQRRFSAVLRTSLDRSTGTLRARPADYAPELVGSVRAAGVDPAERLAVYNRQYWYRLFGVLQQDHRLTVALVGAWSFNGFATDFLLAKPPEGHDLADITDGFASFLGARLPASLDVQGRQLPRQVIVEALAIDLAFRAAALAPAEPGLRLGPADAARLPGANLVWSRSLSLVDEHWPLVELRQRLPAVVDDEIAPLPAAHPEGRTWAIHRTQQGLHARPISSLHAELLRLLQTQPIGRALAELEARHSSGAVAARVKEWFAADLASGFWTGLGDGA
jgi:hypothetical protein